MQIFYRSLVVILVCYTACKQNKDSAPDTVAKVGERVITWQNLEESFILEPRYAVRTPLRAAREAQLNYLIDQEYYFLAAEIAGLENDSTILGKLAYIERQETLKAFLREQFLDSVFIAPDEVIEGLQRFSQVLHVKNIFRREPVEILKIQGQLQRYPASVRDIFTTAGADLGWITFGMIDPELEKAVYGLKAGEYSDVIQTEGGHHLLFVEDIRINGDYQQINSRMRMEQVQDALRKRKAHAAILAFLKQRAGAQKIRINNRLTEKVAAIFDANKGEHSNDPTILQPPLSGDELDMIDLDLAVLSNAPLARFGEAELTVGEFLQRLNEMPPYHRPYIQGRARLVQVLLDIMRNDMLTAAAMERGYALRANVRKEIGKERRDLLAREFSIRYHSDAFQSYEPEKWAVYESTLNGVRETTSNEIYEDHLFTAGEDPDSILTDAPIPVFLKNRYQW